MRLSRKCADNLAHVRRYTLSEDDGLTVAYKAGQARTTEFSLQGDAGGHAHLGISVTGSLAAGLGAEFWYNFGPLFIPLNCQFPPLVLSV